MLLLTTPALAHTSGLAPAETAGVGRTTSETRAQTVRQLVDDDASLEIAVAVRVRSVPEVHPAATVLAVGRRHEVGIVVTRAVLRVRDDGVVLLPTTTEVVLLEVTRDLVEAVAVVEVVHEVRRVEQLGHRRIDVLLGLLERVVSGRLLGVVLEVERLGCTGVGAVAAYQLLRSSQSPCAKRMLPRVGVVVWISDESLTRGGETTGDRSGTGARASQEGTRADPSSASGWSARRAKGC